MSNFDWLEKIVESRSRQQLKLLMLEQRGMDQSVRTTNLSPNDEIFIATMGTLADKMMDVIKAAEASRSTVEPVLANYVMLDVALAALQAARKDMG